MAVCVLRYGFADLGLEKIAAITNLENLASQRVLLKAGLARHGERTFTHPALAPEGPMAWFEADRAGWLRAHPAAGRRALGSDSPSEPPRRRGPS
jgi:RimJ/RimL family protein N-acetyltransferase